MIIKSIKLNNIRSYIKENIDFPKGSTILSGDIGSGKSTILMAIEFALFSPIRTAASGNALLRHGAKNGYIEMVIDLDGQEITIRRNLHRATDKVIQDNGYILIDNVKHDLSPVQIKAKVLEILSYPIEFLTKQNIDIFQFSVYTPQEKIKEIITTDAENRKDILNSIFDIDKYKIINDANDLTISELNKMIKILEKKKQGVEQDREEYNQLLIDQKNLKENKTEKESILKQWEIEKEENDKKLIELEDIMKYVIQKRTNLENFINLKTKNNTKIQDLKNKNETMKDSINKIKDETETLTNKITKIENDEPTLTNEISEIEKTINSKSEEIGQLKENINTLEKILNDGICGICEQKVQDKKSFKEKINQKHQLKDLRKNEIDKFKLKVEENKKLLNTIRENYNISQKIDQLEQTITNQLTKITDNGEEIDNLSKENNELIEKIKQLKEDLESKKNISDQIIKYKETMNNINKEITAITSDLKSIEVKIEFCLEKIEQKMNAITEKGNIDKDYVHLLEIREWTKNQLPKILKEIEIQSTISILSDFNNYFREWFQLLVQDQSLDVKIDDNFSPIIIQNGYDTDFKENLSGGEGTSVALSYRLALNQVINNQKQNIKTRDLLILDEPTYGFSREQLKNVRNVFKNLQVQQLIVVSHEQEVEGFVDNVIHIEKKNNISKIQTKVT